MLIVGLSCDYHDAAAAVIEDGAVLAAAEEERFTRVKHDASLPRHALASCLAIAGADPNDVDVVVFHEKPLVVAGRVLAARQRRGPRGVSAFVREMPTMLRRNLMVADRIESVFRSLGRSEPPRIVFGEHHLSHASAAFLPSPFRTAAILTIDGIGEWATATVGHGVNHRVRLLADQRYPHSLGLLYSLATRWCGFVPNDGEYKLMGLAPYGEPRFADSIREFVDLHDDGSLTIDQSVIRRWGNDAVHSKRLARLLGGPPLALGGEPTQREADLARSIQELTETSVLAMASHARSTTGERRICLAGGVALNCVANGRLLRESGLDDVWIQPAAGDAGSALGAALWYWHDQLEHERCPAPAISGGPPADGLRGAALGPRFSDDEIEEWLTSAGIPSERIESDDERCGRVAAALANGAVVGWFSGPMEFGPRALGHRSILADPRSPTVHRDLNLRVKGRESFRPFAPAVLWEHAGEWFDIDRPSAYMLLTHQVAEHRLREVLDEPESLPDRAVVRRSEIPACTHVDGSARVQTVHRETNPEFHRLLGEFRRITDCPVLLNTSFNVAGEPIVCTPEDALATAVRAGLDLLVLEHHIVSAETLRGLAADAHASVGR